jgi:hypothetical protein
MIYIQCANLSNTAIYTFTSLLVPGDSGRLVTLIYVVTVETSRFVKVRHTHVRSHCGNPATRAGMAHLFT